MSNLNRLYFCIGYGKLFIFYYVKIKCRSSGIFFICKSIRKTVFYLSSYSFHTIQRHIFSAPENQRTHIIQSDNVVVVLMCKQSSINMIFMIQKHLLSEIRTAINKDLFIFFGGYHH